MHEGPFELQYLVTKLYASALINILLSETVFIILCSFALCSLLA